MNLSAVVQGSGQCGGSIVVDIERSARIDTQVTVGAPGGIAEGARPGEVAAVKREAGNEYFGAGGGLNGTPGLILEGGILERQRGSVLGLEQAGVGDGGAGVDREGLTRYIGGHVGLIVEKELVGAELAVAMDFVVGIGEGHRAVGPVEATVAADELDAAATREGEPAAGRDGVGVIAEGVELEGARVVEGSTECAAGIIGDGERGAGVKGYTIEGICADGGECAGAFQGASGEGGSVELHGGTGGGRGFDVAAGNGVGAASESEGGAIGLEGAGVGEAGR